MLIFCKTCGYSEELDADSALEYVGWSVSKRIPSPFRCVECGDELMDERDWEVS